MFNNHPLYYCNWFAFLSFLASGNPQQPQGTCLSQDRRDIHPDRQRKSVGLHFVIASQHLKEEKDSVCIASLMHQGTLLKSYQSFQ